MVSYDVIQVKLNQLVYENVHMTINLQQNTFKRHHNDKYFSEVYPQDGSKTS